MACAQITASHGLKTLVLERKEIIGRKVCAGGITWNGLLKKVPEQLAERHFHQQHIFTRLQKTCVTARTPIIATVNRENLGNEMAKQALKAGAEIRLGCQVTSVSGHQIHCTNKGAGTKDQYSCTFLVGADGSTSLVRKNLGLPVENSGIGITYQIPGDYPDMEWHLNSSLFANGYAWVFPHRDSASIGAYVDARKMKANKLKTNLLAWGEKRGYPLKQYKSSAELINFDFRGWRFTNTFLVGDAAGLASGLTGEGIYPAIISGETVGHHIANPNCDTTHLQNLIKNHRMHTQAVGITGKNVVFAIILAEIITFCLKTKFLDFSVVEMAR